jgi:transposase
MEKILTAESRLELLKRHRKERDSRVADRIKVVLLRDDGWSFEAIAEALFLSDEGVRQQFKDYVESNGVKLKPENGGSNSLMNEEQSMDLIRHLDKHIYIKALDICAYVQKTYGVSYSVRGMNNWLERHDFTFHQPCGIPAKADSEKQAAFIEEYKKLKNSLPDDDHIVFMDGVHPTHMVRFRKGWIRKGERKEIPTNGSQKRLNILGALDLEKMVLHAREFDTINATNVIAFLMTLMTLMPSGIIHVILDQAGYHTCKETTAWLLKNPRVKLHYLPAYSPNLNAIEPCWKIMHEHTTNNVYYSSFKQFSEKIWEFFHHTFPQKAQSWTDRLTDNFRIIGSKSYA